MKIMQLLIVGLALCVAGVAQATTLSAVPTPPGEGSPDNVDEYFIDDGISENSIGLTAGGTIYWVNRFNVLAGFGTVTHVRVAWGQYNSPRPSMVLVWDDPNNDNNPGDVTGAHVLTSLAVVSDAGNTDAFFTYDVTDAGVGGTGDTFYVGVCGSQTAGEFPARIDQTPPNNFKSWVGGDSSQTAQCTNPNGGNVLPLTIIDTLGFPGDWMVRANATGTTPVEARTWGNIKATYNY